MIAFMRPLYPQRGSFVLRRGRWSEDERIYLVTFTCDQRIPLFADWETATHAARAFIEPRLWRSSHLLCWVLMPDHWHGLVQLRGQDALSPLIGRVKAITARAINEARGGKGRVWSPGFHDHALRCNEDLPTVARYIIANPVRAHLCQRAGHYPFWNAIWLD